MVKNLGVTEGKIAGKKVVMYQKRVMCLLKFYQAQPTGVEPDETPKGEWRITQPLALETLFRRLISDAAVRNLTETRERLKRNNLKKESDNAQG